MTYKSLDSLALPVLAYSGIWLWPVSISDEGSLPEITLSDASKIVSTIKVYMCYILKYIVYFIRFI